MNANAVLDRYQLCTIRTVQPLGDRGGFSGARIWRVTTAAGDFCLKAWPPEQVTEANLGWIHELLAHASRAGLDFVPRVLSTTDGSRFVRQSGRLWDLSTWLPGVADFNTHPSRERLASASTTVARLHLAWHTHVPGVGRCPGIERRLNALHAFEQLVRSGWKLPAVGQAFLPAAGERGKQECLPHVAAKAWSVLIDLVPRAQRLLEPWKNTVLPLHPCWCDPWHDNLLFDGNRLNGLIDYGSVKIDHGGVDLARLLGSLAGNDAELWSAGLEAYHAVRPLSETELALIPILDRSGLVVAAANWLRWLYHEDRGFADREAAAHRFGEVVARLERLSLSGDVG